MMIGLVGAWYSCVRHHRPDLEIKVTGKDFTAVVAASLAYAVLVLPMYLKVKGFL
jgi:hypothetical protein